MNFCSFASGSSGNCYMVKTEKAAILIDAGISGKKILEGLSASDTALESVKGIFITHEHSDHVKSIRVLGKKLPDARCYASPGTWEHIAAQVAEGKGEQINAGDETAIGDMSVRAFRLSHDADDPIGYSISAGGRQISIVTDTGVVTDDIMAEARMADLLVLEANHEVNVLRTSSRYPLYVQQRILGDKGHLSNDAAGECICRITQDVPKRRRILLAHLSSNHNTPELALMAVSNILECNGIYPGRDLELEVIGRDISSSMYEL